MQATTAQEIYIETVRALPPTERLRLAALILDELTQDDPSSAIDDSASWSRQDQSDLTAFALQHAAAIYPENDELV